MEPMTMFSFGYWGWGSAVPQLVESIDAVEKARGFAPPLFVDIRISRAVRAPGFNGATFEAVVGKSRYRWLDDLGNVGIQDKGAMRIKNPGAVNTLLDLGEECARNNRRLIFFCPCPRPCGCHRMEVARLALKAAATRNMPVEIVEWPGGEPSSRELEVELSEDDFEKVRASHRRRA